MPEELRIELVKSALQAREHSYVPYSRYRVGAALMTADGKIYQGCNVENASYGATNCAERTAFFKAVSDGERYFKAIAIAGGPEDGEITDYAYPCGICRQVMQEFCGPEFLIIVVKNEEVFKCLTLEQLLPHGFGAAAMR